MEHYVARALPELDSECHALGSDFSILRHKARS